MDLLPDWAPNLHPLVLHFPIALLVVASGFDLIGLLSRDRGTWRRTADWLYAFGAATAFLTWYTGTLAADSVFLPTDANAVLTEHADLGKYTMWFFSAYAVIRVGISFTSIAARGLFRGLFFVLGIAGIVLLTVTATHGAELVYRYGVGVEAVETRPSERIVEANAETGFAASEEGWIWTPARAAAWKGEAAFLEGSAETIESALVDGGELGDVLELTASEPTLFVFPGVIGRLQVDLALDLSEFEGSVLVAHHVQEDGSYGFTSFGDGTARFGRTENSDLLIQATESVDTGGWRDFRVVVDGTHFRSYADTRMVIHGHGAAFQPGRVGLRINGTGPVRLSMMQAVDLASVGAPSQEASGDAYGPAAPAETPSADAAAADTSAAGAASHDH